jgi:hypothetical protein
MGTSRAPKEPGVPAYRIPRLEVGEGAVIHAIWPERVFRFLLSDGRTVDVRSARDDSDLRGALLKYLNVDRIEGSVILEDPK